MRVLPSSRVFAAPALWAALALTACNALTGVNDLSVGDGEGGPGASSGAGRAGSGAVVPPHVSGAGGGASSSSATGATTPPVDPLLGAQGVTVGEIAVYQGVKCPLMENGAPAGSDIPVVAGRDALVRVFAHTDASYDGQPVTARLHLGGSAPLEVVQVIGGAPSEGVLDSTINFQVPGSAIVAGGAYSVELLQPPKGAGDNAAARFPASGTAPLGARSSGAKLSIVLVPVAYGADGSGRVPDTSAAQIQAYRDMMFSVYPIPAIEITVRAPFSWSSPVNPDGSGWGDLLGGIADLRQQDAPASDAYYFGVFDPAASFGDYCGGGCTAGLGYVIGADGASFRAAIGLGWAGVGEGTMAHEIGHNHGRNHAPCGTSGDPNYPYPDAAIGDWGYDLVHGTLFPPDTTKDLMSYCGPSWVSDYTYKAFFDRLAQVNGASVVYPPDALDRTYERARVNGDGTLSWLAPTTLHTPPLDHPTPVTLGSAAGAATAVGHYVPYDHLPGGVVVWPAPAHTTTVVSMTIEGQAMSLAR
jgi:hypothetical protein